MGYLNKPTGGNYSLVAIDDTLYNVTATVRTTAATFSSLTFAADSVYRVTVFTRMRSATNTTNIGVSLGDGTNTTNLGNIQVAAGNNDSGTFIFYIKQADATTVALSTGEVFGNNYGTGKDGTRATVAASANYADQTQIKVDAWVSASDNTDITKIIIEKLGTV